MFTLRRKEVAGTKDFNRGHELYDQKRYYEAEKHYRRALRDSRAVLGKEHTHTLESKHWLACALERQKKYVEAEELYRQVVQGREKVVGREDVDTLTSKHSL